jgi:hypothetical protein
MREARHKHFDMTRPVGKGMIPSGNRMTLMNRRDRSNAPLQKMEQGLALLSILRLAPLAALHAPEATGEPRLDDGKREADEVPPGTEPEVAALSAHHARQALAL